MHSYQKRKIIRITTIPISLIVLLKGQLGFMNQFYEVIGVSNTGPELNTVERNEKIRTVPIPMTRTISPIQDIKSLYHLIKLFKREKPFIVHSHTPKAGIVAMLAARIAGVPNRLHTVAGMPLLEVKGFKRTILDIVEKLTYSCATKVYPNSNGLYEIIIANKYCIPRKLKVLANGSSNGINTEYFDPQLYNADYKLKFRRAYQINENDFVFVFVGRLVGDKGINELVQAFQTLNDKFVNAKLLLVGPEEAHLDPLQHETIETIASHRNIIAVGGQSDVRPFFAIANALTFPSYREGFPNVVLQAGAMGLPSIVSNINGCNEIIAENENGVIVPVKDVSLLTNAMIQFIADPEKTLYMASNAREAIMARYNQKVVWNAILAEYQNLETYV